MPRCRSISSTICAVLDSGKLLFSHRLDELLQLVGGRAANLDRHPQPGADVIDDFFGRDARTASEQLPTEVGQVAGAEVADLLIDQGGELFPELDVAGALVVAQQLAAPGVAAGQRQVAVEDLAEVFKVMCFAGQQDRFHAVVGNMADGRGRGESGSGGPGKREEWSVLMLRARAGRCQHGRACRCC